MGAQTWTLSQVTVHRLTHFIIMNTAGTRQLEQRPFLAFDPIFHSEQIQ